LLRNERLWVQSPAWYTHTEYYWVHPKFLVEQIWDRASEFAFLKSSQVMLMLLIQKLYLENYYSSLL
jgi:hypothetical protein